MSPQLLFDSQHPLPCSPLSTLGHFLGMSLLLPPGSSHRNCTGQSRSGSFELFFAVLQHNSIESGAQLWVPCFEMSHYDDSWNTNLMLRCGTDGVMWTTGHSGIKLFQEKSASSSNPVGTIAIWCPSTWNGKGRESKREERFNLYRFGLQIPHVLRLWVALLDTESTTRCSKPSYLDWGLISTRSYTRLMWGFAHLADDVLVVGISLLV